jgi:hypothetical protein
MTMMILPRIENIPGRADTWKLGPLALPFFQRHLCP